MMILRSIRLLGTQLTLCDRDQLLEFVQQTVESNDRAIVLSGNIHSFNLAYRQDWLRDFFNQADAVRIDGAGVRLGARILGHRTPKRMTWADFMWDLARVAESRRYRMFFLGARPGVAALATVRLRDRFPDLDVVGEHHGYFDKAPGSPENEAVIRTINTANPDVLVVGFGMPLQERWLRDNWHRVHTNVVLTGGGVFDYISGELRRPPLWMTGHGLEWLGRMIVEPRRLWRRYLVGNPLFIWRVLKQRIASGLARDPGKKANESRRAEDTRETS